MTETKKSLGQHWLHDETALLAVADAAEVGPDDTVLEVGPGLGTLTNVLVQRAHKVVAVEFDTDLARDLSSRVLADNLEVIHQDILAFDLSKLPRDYKVAANIPYYLTSKLVRLLLESPKPPAMTALLVQKEVAERMAAQPGALSILGISVQFYCEATLREMVPAKLFTPPPEVDSQIIQLVRRSHPLFTDVTPQQYFRIVRAGFSEKRKKLRSSLSGGLHLSKEAADAWLATAQISPEARAQELSLEDWHRLVTAFDRISPDL
ncbi:MAG TPA: 16S rRNA (adenine(1518)-N(6)/adenine(1519)-N(6))-dimethyltransferase RsmA [Candidatus Saccharimonadales bacterium]|nr:16S rRNA (adenine(1518)-N(6)/adenine(1519)-N(6))-dimethyltransferase RsmA [Candidatus Saccharimonadales bacterium]